MKREERMRAMHEKGLTYEDIGQIECISKQRVGQILHPSNAEPPIWLTTRQAAKYLGVHINTLRLWANEGRVKCARLVNTRRDRRFSRQELNKLRECESDSTKGGDAMKS